MSRLESSWNPFDDQSDYLDRFGLLLLITVVAVVALSLFDLRQSDEDVLTELGQLAVSIFVGATLLLAVRASGVARRYRVIADVVVLIGIAITAIIVLVEIFADTGAAPEATAPFTWIVLSVFAPVLVIRRMIQHRRATARTLLGAVSAYLLIALAFNFAFLAIDGYGETFFETEEPTTSFMYFSLVTITTLGYGDLAPAEPLGRLLATTEAVIGQVYLVTFVAMIVGLLVAQRRTNVESR